MQTHHSTYSVVIPAKAGIHVAAIFLLLLLPTVATAQKQNAPCLAQLHEALAAHHAAPDSGQAVRRVMRITTVRQGRGGADTTVSRTETVHWNGGEMIRSEGTAIWSDEKTMVIVEEKAKRLRVVDLSDKRKILAAQKRFQGVFADSLIGYGREFGCEELGEQGDRRSRISFRIDTTKQAFFNAAAMSVEVNAGGEIVRMGITHPRGSAVLSTEYVVEEMDRSWEGMELGEAVLGQFVDAAGHLRPSYAAYRVVR